MGAAGTFVSALLWGSNRPDPSYLFPPHVFAIILDSINVTESQRI